MLPRVVAGVVLCLIGALWIAQGVGVAEGSFMTDNALWAYIGAAAIVGGLGLVAAGARR
jgi:hypothetical protein